MELNSCRDNQRQSRLINPHKYKSLSILGIILLFNITVLLSLPGADGKLTMEKECGEIVCKTHHYCSNHDQSCRPCQLACDSELKGNYDKSVCERDCQDYLHDLWYMRKPENDSAPRLTEELYVDLYYKMQEDLRLLKILIGVVIIMSTLVMMALFGIMIYFKHLKRKLGINPSTTSDGLTNDDSESREMNNKKKQKKIMDLPVIYSNNRVLSLPINNLQTEKGAPSHVSSNSVNNNLSRGSTPDLVSRSVSSLNSTSLPTQNSKKPSSAKMTQSERQQKMRREPSESTLPEYTYDNPALVPSPTHM